MRYLLCVLMAFLSLIAFGQDVTESTSVDSIPRTKTVFAELLGWNTNVFGLGSNAKVEVDFGEENWSGWRGNDGRNLLVDEEGKQIKFNSMIDAMNFMGERGWKFEAAYIVTVAGQNVIHWLMSKVIPMDGYARDGIKQLRDTKKSKKDKYKHDKNNKSDDPLYN